MLAKVISQMAVAKHFLPQVEYSASRAFAPSGYQKIPTDKFFKSASRKRTGGPSAETDLREGALEKRRQTTESTNLRSKKVTWGKLSVEDPYRDVITSSTVSASVQSGNHGVHSGQTVASGTSRTATVGGRSATSDISGSSAVSSSTVTAMDTSGVGGTNAEGAVAAGGESAMAGAVSEGRHIEASGKNLDDGWVESLVSSARGYSIDLASLNYEMMVGNMKGFKKLSNSKYGELRPNDAFVKSVVEGGTKRDYKLSMLDSAATASEDPFGKRKWNATPANDIANQSMRGLVNTNHEGALMFNRGLNQLKNAHIRNPERDVGLSEVREAPYCPADVIVINSSPMEIEDSMHWYAPNANEGTLGFHDTHDRLASKLANSANNAHADNARAGTNKRGELAGRGTSTVAPNVLASDEPWVAQASTSGSWLGANRPTHAMSDGVGFNRSRISAGADQTQGGVGPAGVGQGGFNNGSSASNSMGNRGYGGTNTQYSQVSYHNGQNMSERTTGV